MRLLLQFATAAWGLSKALYELGASFAPEPPPELPTKTEADVVRPEKGELMADHFGA
jgi:hypothetical protein